MAALISEAATALTILGGGSRPRREARARLPLPRLAALMMAVASSSVPPARAQASASGSSTRCPCLELVEQIHPENDLLKASFRHRSDDNGVAGRQIVVERTDARPGYRRVGEACGKPVEVESTESDSARRCRAFAIQHVPAAGGGVTGKDGEGGAVHGELTVCGAAGGGV